MRKDIYKDIPESLRSSPNWLLYKIEMIKQKDGTEKPTKVPYNARTGRKADPTDPKNWSSFEQVLSVLEADRSYAGPGFAISPGFMFVDYDKCRDPQTGVIDKSVAAKVAFLDSYTEISPSGTGLHVLCHSNAPLPAGRRKLNHVEMYDGKRFATMTGDHLEGTPVSVENRTEELLSAYNEHFGQCDSKSNSAAEQKRAAVVVPITSTSDEAILTDCRAAKNAAKFSRLFDDGDTSEYGGNHSNADGALCAILAYRTRDGEQIDRLFRQSALFRPKWDEQRGTRTYGQVTIDTALSLQKTLPPGFTLTEDGVFYQSPGNGDDENTSSMFICSRLEIVGASRNAEGGDWSRILRWNDPEGRVHEWLMPMSMLAGEGNEIIAELLGRGLVISPTRKGRELLRTYIQTAKAEKLQTSVNRLGWHDHCFVLPDCTLGCKEEAQSLIFHSQSSVEHEFKVSGSLQEWQERISRYCVGNSRMLFAVSTAFAASVMRLVDAECGIIQLIGLSSTGKSTLLRIAASVNGSRKSVRNWRSTANGLESTIALHNDLLLILDELGQANPKDIGEIVYLIGNGSGKMRATRNGGVRAVAQWLTLVLSSGELTLREHMASVGAKTKGGQEVRCLDLPADAEKGYGAFEKLHGHRDAAGFADTLTQAAAEVYGIAGRTFLTKITGHVEETRSWLQQQIKLFIHEQCEQHDLQTASGEIYRALSRFALIGATGGLATRLRVTGWRDGDATQAAATCFAAWFSKRGSKGASDVEAGIRKVKTFIELHGSSRFQEIKLLDDEQPPQKTFHRAGFFEKKSNGNVYYILPESFRDEVCAGYNAEAVLKELKRQGHLQCDADRLTYKRTLPDFGKKGSYAILPSLFQEPDAPKRLSLSELLDEDAA